MGWETRKGRQYLYLKRREGGRVTSQYIGAAGADSELPALCEAFVREQREERDFERAMIRREQEEIEALSEQVATVCEGIEALARATMILAGYHQHDRGHWRKRRMGVRDGHKQEGSSKDK